MHLDVEKIRYDACARYGSLTDFANAMGISLTRLCVILKNGRVLRKNGAVLPSVTRMLGTLCKEGEEIWTWIVY